MHVLVFAAVVGGGWPGYIVSCDDRLLGDVRWALGKWGSVFSSDVVQRPMSFRVSDLDKDTTLGTFFGCTPVCDIRIDPRALPSLARVTLMHEIGHALGFVHGAATPFAAVESEFGARAGLWVAGAHWSDSGEGLLMHARIGGDSRLSSSGAHAVAAILGVEANACAADGECGRGRSCAARGWPLPGECRSSPRGATGLVLVIAAGVSATVSLLILL